MTIAEQHRILIVAAGRTIVLDDAFPDTQQFEHTRRCAPNRTTVSTTTASTVVRSVCAFSPLNPAANATPTAQRSPAQMSIIWQEYGISSLRWPRTCRWKRLRLQTEEDGCIAHEDDEGCQDDEQWPEAKDVKNESPK